VAVLAGEGSLRDSLAARVKEAGLSDRVHMPGVVDPLGPLLAACDACLLPSLWEGLPLVVLEALARGKPVVASRVGGIPEAIEDCVTGRLVPPGDAAALAAVLEDFHRRADAAARLGLAGAERVHESFTWDKVVEAFETVYDEVLGLASFSPEAPDPATRAPERGRARAERPGARR
jgi:glycosyltransferase involved in cell wall biosynthesis